MADKPRSQRPRGNELPQQMQEPFASLLGQLRRAVLLESRLQPPGDTPRGRNCGTGKKAREIDYVYAISQIGGLFLAFARAYPTIEASSAITDNRS